MRLGRLPTSYHGEEQVRGGWYPDQRRTDNWNEGSKAHHGAPE